ncbi:Retrovirus-related Pol polyprotein from transposon RE2 [Vitis vinifera]|uniref:Retrovirus-related Pol polyprotein from transposon RE2 n=1 Tax=Vitis vinifera TaxID=29760 RepID=A0A438I7K7_VITVI|nr:Retrovirus-related Pol polyprotein from transposon RE2 [Vitis vinifera]
MGVGIKYEKYPKLFIAKMQYAKTINIPMASGLQLKAYESDTVESAQMYVNSCNLEADWKAIKGILKYLRGTLEFGLVLRKASTATALDLVGFCDANRASDKDDQRSTSGYRVYLGPKLIAWQSQKQHTIFRSSTEAKYRSLANLIAEMS